MSIALLELCIACQLLLPLQSQGLLDCLQPAGEHPGGLRGSRVGFLAAALDGELRGVKLFLDLQVAAQHILGVRFVRFPRNARLARRAPPPNSLR